MKKNRWCAVLCLMIMQFALPFIQAQQNSPHIGYVYPAGGKVGSDFEVVIGGQFLTGLTNVFVSGGGVQATIVDYVRPIGSKELNDLRIKIDELLARKAVVRNDFKALENFRSFKTAKTIKNDDAKEDKDIEELKKKYAGAKWTDEDEKMLADVRKKATSGVRRPENPAISEIAMFRFVIDPDAKPGDREVRIATPQGLTNPMLFKIGKLTEFSEPAIKKITQQRTVKEAQTGTFRVVAERKDMDISLPAVVNGQIMAGTVDRFRFKAGKGVKLVIASSARELIPYLADAVPGWFQATLALYDSSGKEVAYDDDFRFNPDPVLYYEIPADGEYVLEIRDSIYRGREDFVYRITIGELPFITSIFPLGGSKDVSTTVELRGWNLPASRVVFDAKDKTPGIYPIWVKKDEWFSNVSPFAVDDVPDCLEKEPDSQHRTAQAITLPVIVNGSIDHPDDRDFFKFEGKAGDEIVAEVFARRLNSPLDSKLVLSDSDSKQLACNDDCEDKSSGLETHHADSYLRARLPADGTYYVEVVDTQHQGGPDYAYRMRVSKPRPDFSLRVVPSSINLRAGGTVAVTFYALRQDGFTNSISISLKDAPEGFRLGGATIQSTQEQVRITLTAPPIQQKQPVKLNFLGRAMVDGREVVHSAVPAEDMMQAFAYRHLVPSKEFQVGIGGKFQQKADVKILSKLPVLIPIGGTAAVKLNIPKKVLDDKAELELNNPPDGITIQKTVQSGLGMEIILAAEEGKAKVGQKGNIIIDVYAKPASSGKNKKLVTGRFKATTLPAIPFEVIAK